MENLTVRHRPKQFHKVEGQEHAVEFLSQLIIQGQLCRNVLLHGAIGSGKTTLARIYAKALSCHRPRADGSPCLDCKSCTDMESGKIENFSELDGPSFEKFDEFKGQIDALVRHVSGRHKRVIFVDEAHSLARYEHSFDYLLKKVEEPDPGIAYCFATTAFGKLSPALRSRLHCLEIRPLLLSESIAFLKRIADEEKIQTSPDALKLIADLGEGQPRNMLHALEVVSQNGDVTIDRVRRIYNFCYTEVLKRYFIALGRGDLQEQTDIFFKWNEDTREKVRLIQLFMVSLYYNELCKLSLTIDAVIASISASDREQILAPFRERLGEVNLKAFWERLIQAWPIISSNQSEESLLILITEYQRRVCDASEPFAQRQTDDPLRPSACSQLPVGLPPARTKKKVRGIKIGKDPRYLTYDQVSELYNKATFLTQEYGLEFNTQITVQASLFGCETKSEASKLLSDVTKAFGDRLRRWINQSHWLCVHEQTDPEGVLGRIIAVGPQPRSREYQRMEMWLSRWRRKERTKDLARLAIALSVPSSPRKATPKMKAHWDCVRWLCAGLNPEEPLYKHLQLPKSRKAGELGPYGRRYSASESLLPSGMSGSMRNGMEALSALDDEAWDFLYSGWELKEFHDRQKEKRQREEEIKEVSLIFPGDQSKLEERLKIWPDRYRRPRSWEMWPLSES